MSGAASSQPSVRISSAGVQRTHGAAALRSILEVTAVASAFVSRRFLCKQRRHAARLARRATVERPLTPSSPSSFLGESEVRASEEDLKKNRDLFANAILPAEEGGLFRAHKERILEKTLLYDRSPKGSVDFRIMGILDELNKREQFVTTSSCSGRVLFVSHDERVVWQKEQGSLSQGAKSHTGRWRISHDGIANADDYFDLEAEGLRDNLGDLWLHVQAMELQVACANLAEANRLIAVIKKVFQRAYVKSAGKEWKTLVQADGMQHIQMPFALSGRRVFGGSNEEMTRIVNTKLQRNWDDMERLLEVLKTDL